MVGPLSHARPGGIPTLRAGPGTPDTNAQHQMS